MTDSAQQIRASTTGLNVSGNMSSTAAIWGFAILWNLVIVAMYYGARTQRHPPPIWFFMIFFAAGALLLVLAIYVTLSRVKYGKSTFELQTALAVPGGVVIGTIHIPRPFIFHDAIHLRLVCFKGVMVTPRGGNDMRGWEEQQIVWEGLCTLDRISAGTAISQIPVCFRIPSNAAPSDDSQMMGQILWRLEAKAKTSGMTYAAAFLVPVHAGHLPPDVHSIHDPTAALRSPEPARRQLLDRHIHLTPLPGGGCQCEMTAGRGMGMAIGLGIFGMMCIGVVLAIFMFTNRPRDVGDYLFFVVSTLFCILFSVIGILLLLIAASIGLNWTMITARRGSIIIKSNTLLFRREEQLAAATIQEFTVKVDGQAGNHAYYSIHVTKLDASSLEVCRYIGNKSDAEWLVAEFKKEIFGESRAKPLPASPAIDVNRAPDV